MRSLITKQQTKAVGETRQKINDFSRYLFADKAATEQLYFRPEYKTNCLWRRVDGLPEDVDVGASYSYMIRRVGARGLGWPPYRRRRTAW